jgi:hypothetical protein
MAASRLVLTVMLTIALLAAPLAAEAQSPVARGYRVGFLSASRPLPALSGPEPSDPAFRAFVHDLRKFGYVEGQNLVLERRSAEGRFERLPDLAAELVRLKLDVIVASGGPTTRAVKQATTTIPIVMAPAGDPLGAGWATSLARPGGNLTGLSNVLDYPLDGKRLELLKEVLPRAARVGVIHQTPPTPGQSIAAYAKELIAAAEALRVALVFAKADQADQFPEAFATLARARWTASFSMTTRRPLRIGDSSLTSPRSIGWRPCTRSGKAWRLAASCPMGQAFPTLFGARPGMSTKSSRAPTRAIFPLSGRQSSTSSSTSRPRRPSA